ncbi:MAG: SurA N-terminal domain-containing protein [Pseudomonadota bacterium]|nr:SurA N-terminal domain-containing protein [Pseudomonadota bacterium]
MLGSIRKRTGGIVVKGLTGLLVISFGAWGINDMLTGRFSISPAVKVGNTEIDARDLELEIRNELNRMQRLYGANFDVEQARQLGVIDAVISQRVTNILLGLGASDLGVLISDNQIRDRIRSEERFRGLGNNFDRNRFERFLQISGYTEGSYLSRLRRDMAAEQFLHSLDAGATTSRKAIDAIYRYRNEQRYADTIIVADDNIMDVPEPGPQELDKYHRDNKARFTAPEYRQITVNQLEARDLAKEISVSDLELQNAYEAREAEFNQPESRRLMQMIMADEEIAKRARELLIQGGDFAEIAKAMADQDAASLDLGSVTKNDLLTELSVPVFAIGANQVTEPLESPLGWHLIKVMEITPGGQQSFAEVRDTLRILVANEKAVDGLFDLSNRLEDELGGGATLEEAAANLNLPVTRIDSIDRTGRDKNGAEVPDLPSGDKFLETAFSTAEGEDSPLTEAGTEAFFILRIDAVTSPALRPLDLVRNEVAAEWKAQARREKAEKLAQSLVERINTGTVFKSVAEEARLTPSVIGPVTREQRGQVPASLAASLFDLEIGKAAMARVEGGYQIATLTQVAAAQPAEDRDGVDRLSNQLRQSVKQDILEQLAESLQARHTVSVNRQLVDNLFSSNVGQ